ncbi:MAG: hypothetical protein WCC08_03795 [Terrimicrobiaceae bacterium]
MKAADQHLDTLNEAWWVSRWHGIDGDSLRYEYLSQSAAERRRSGSPPTVDWSFTIFGGQLRVNLEVKNRVGTYVSPRI